MAIQGLRDSSNFATDERPKNWREGILRLYPNGKAPLAGLTSAMKSRSVDDAEFNWWEKSMQERRVAATADVAAADVSITVASGAKSFKEGDLLLQEKTGEIMMVSADPSSDTLIPVTRDFPSTVTPTLLDISVAGTNPNHKCIGSAYEEGSDAPTGVAFDPTKKYNYTQIFRNTLEATRTATKTRLRTKETVNEMKREALELHSIDMENAFWEGVRLETTKNGKPIRTTGGVFSWIAAANIVTADTTTGCSLATFEEYLRQAFRKGSSEKMGFCGDVAMLTIQQIVRKNSTWNIQTGIREFGMNVSRITCPFGELILKTHPLFTISTGGDVGGTLYYGRNSWLCILDMAELMYVYLKDSDTKYEPKLQGNGVDGLKSGYITEAGIEIHHPEAHYLIKNLAKPAVDA